MGSSEVKGRAPSVAYRPHLKIVRILVSGRNLRNRKMTNLTNSKQQTANTITLGPNCCILGCLLFAVGFEYKIHFSFFFFAGRVFQPKDSTMPASGNRHPSPAPPYPMILSTPAAPAGRREDPAAEKEPPLFRSTVSNIGLGGRGAGAEGWRFPLARLVTFRCTGGGFMRRL